MDNGIHFISGLPRSGSTLLSALLLQNPALHAGITSPVGSLAGALLRDMSAGNETSVFVDDGQREALLRGIFDNYYFRIHPTRTVFDTNRVWCIRLHMIASLFPRARVICCVRNIAWVVDSIERLLRQNRFELSKIFDFDSAGTVYSRSEALTHRSGMVGFALDALKQAMHSPESDRLMLLSYETLTREPGRAMEAVYEFTGLPPYRHDFENIVFDAAQFDARLGTPGLHSIGRSVRPTERQSLLPPDLWRRYAAESVWRDPDFNKRGIRLV